MPKDIVQGALMQCDKGVSPVPLLVTSQTACFIQNKLQATEKDCTITNIPSFGKCNINPLLPCPCIPQPIAWQNTSPFTIQNCKELTDASFCMCAKGGKISFLHAGQEFVKSC